MNKWNKTGLQEIRDTKLRRKNTESRIVEGVKNYRREGERERENSSIIYNFIFLTYEYSKN